MRAVAIILLLFGLQPAQLDQQWGEVIRNERLAVEIERVLYERKEDPRFFVHVRIRNRGSETLELDLRDRWNVVYPNQMADIDVLSIRGQLFATDGAQVWTAISAGPGFAPTDFAIPRPVTWKSIPAGATVVVQL